MLQGFGRWRSGWLVILLALTWLWVWSMPVTSDALRASLESRYAYLPVEAVPRADAIVVLDNEARTTQQDVAHIAQLLEAHGLESFLLVTSASHMRRSEAVFRAGGLEPIPVATDFRVGPDPVPRLRRYLPSVEALSGSTAAVHEVVGYWFYRVRGWVFEAPAARAFASRLAYNRWLGWPPAWVRPEAISLHKSGHETGHCYRRVARIISVSRRYYEDYDGC